MHIGSERVEAYAGPESKHLGKEFQGTEYPKCGLKWVRLQGGSDGKESVCNAGALGLIPGSRRSPEEGVATYSSILAWRIPWTGESGGLQSMGSQRAGHD